LFLSGNLTLVKAVYGFVCNCHILAIRDARLTAKGNIFSCSSQCFTKLVKVWVFKQVELYHTKWQGFTRTSHFTWPVSILSTRFNQFEKPLII